MEQRTPTGNRRGGFTLIELLIVMSIVTILVSLAIPVYQRSIMRAKESVLRSNLMTIRNVIDEYTYDKQKAPQTLQDLVDAGYLKALPKDPFTDSTSTWVPDMEDTLRSLDSRSLVLPMFTAARIRQVQTELRTTRGDFRRHLILPTPNLFPSTAEGYIGVGRR